MTTRKDQEIDWVVRKSSKGMMNSRMRSDELKDGGTPQCGMSLQISIRWKWLRGTLRVSNDAPLKAHIDEELRSNGHRGEYNISRPSDGNCNGYVRERWPPWLNEGNMPQYDIRCIRSVLVT